MISADDRRFMDHAVAVAHRALGSTAPNPAVGAVVVRGGVVLGEGFTRPVGGPHAEVEALAATRAAGHDPDGSTLYVTLEPCRHHGRTPPCTDALLTAGIRRVVVGVVDPNPLMCGSSLDLLRGAGVTVDLGVGAEPCADLVRGFTRAITSGLPEVVAKVAISLDGRIATASGESRWVTGPIARAHGVAARAAFDAVVVGANTVRVDDPRLTARGGVHDHQPVPVVLASRGDLDPKSKIFDHPQVPILFVADDLTDGRRAALGAFRAEVEAVPRGTSGLQVEAVLRALVRRGLHRVWVEGGGRVLRSFLDGGWVDELRLYLAGIVIPGEVPWVGGPPVASLSEAIRFGAPVVEPVGGDLLLRYPREASCSPG